MDAVIVENVTGIATERTAGSIRTEVDPRKKDMRTAAKENMRIFLFSRQEDSRPVISIPKHSSSSAKSMKKRAMLPEPSRTTKDSLISGKTPIPASPRLRMRGSGWRSSNKDLHSVSRLVDLSYRLRSSFASNRRRR